VDRGALDYAQPERNLNITLMSKQEYYRRRKLVQAISPEDKLRYLNSYMKLWVKKYPMPAWYTFDKFLEMLVADQLKAKAYYGERTGGKCGYCGQPFTSVFQETRDHVHPKSRGGILHSGNKVPACISCNQWKADRSLYQWKQEVALLHEATAAGMIRLPSPFNRKRLGAILFNLERIMERRAKACASPHP
jgi:5-methylcytosine-specific restriction endonuclease McrA